MCIPVYVWQSVPIKKQIHPQVSTSFLQAELELQLAALQAGVCGAMEDSPLGDSTCDLETDPYGFFDPDRVEADKADQSLYTTWYMSIYITDCYVSYVAVEIL